MTDESFAEELAPDAIGLDDLPSLRVEMPRIGEARELVATSDKEHAIAVLLGNDGGQAVLENIRTMAMAKQRSNHWASLYAEIVGWTGTKAQLLAWIMGQLNCTLNFAQGAVREIQKAPNDPHEIARMCREYLAWYDDPNGPGKDKP